MYLNAYAPGRHSTTATGVSSSPAAPDMLTRQARQVAALGEGASYRSASGGRAGVAAPRFGFEPVSTAIVGTAGCLAGLVGGLWATVKGCFCFCGCLVPMALAGLASLGIYSATRGRGKGPKAPVSKPEVSAVADNAADAVML